MSDYIKKLLFVLGVIIFTSCEVEEIYTSRNPCKGGCDTHVSIDYEVNSNAYLDSNGYWHIEHWGPNYFTVKVHMTDLWERHVINGVPLTEAAFDSNYWVAFDDMKFTIPMYSPFGLYNPQGNPIPVGNKTYDISEIAQLMEPLNIAGYQITKNTCFDCPYSDRLFATYSRYTYEPQQQIYLDKRMIGDTLEIYVKATYNTEGIHEFVNEVRGDKVTHYKTLKVIVHDELPCRNNGICCVDCRD